MNNVKFKAMVRPGDTVTLDVSLGPHLVEVPSVYLSGIADAIQTLHEAGFKVRVRHADPYFGLGFVVEQKPSPHAMAPAGSTVTVYIN